MKKEIVHFDYGVPVRASAGSDKGHAKHGEILSHMHLHKEYEFLTIKSGAIRCVTSDNEYIAEVGDVLFINTYIPHSTYSARGNETNSMIQFNSPVSSDSIFRYIVRLARISDVPCFVFKNGDAITESLKFHINTIIEEYHNRDAFWNDYVQSNLLMLIAILRRNGVITDYIHKKAVELDKIRPVIEFINDNYSSELSTSDLSKILNFNESYFCRLFKKTIGTSALEYLNFVRICKAEHLLRKGMSISDSAYETGFSSLSYFNRVFKKYNHYSPSEYKKISKYTGFEYTDKNTTHQEFYNEEY